MQFKPLTSVALVSVLFLSTGCVQSNEEVGRLTGAVIGGVVGSQLGSGSGKTVATIGGAIIGSLIGGQIGQEMDAEDEARVRRALESAPTDEDYGWVNPDSHVRYVVRPTRTYYQASRPCREYRTTAWVNGNKRVYRGVACRTPSGAWRAVE